MADYGGSRKSCKKLSTSDSGVKRKLRRLSTVGSHDLKKAARITPAAFFFPAFLVSSECLSIEFCPIRTLIPCMNFSDDREYCETIDILFHEVDFHIEFVHCHVIF